VTPNVFDFEPKAIDATTVRYVSYTIAYWVLFVGFELIRQYRKKSFLRCLQFKLALRSVQQLIPVEQTLLHLPGMFQFAKSTHAW
jgi:hypothetical protein